MTISSEIRKAGPFAGNDTSSVFPFDFKVFKSEDLLVVRFNIAASAEQALILNSDYTVTLNNNQNANPGGTIKLPYALPSGWTLTITSGLPYLQRTDLTNQGGFYPTVINDALDRLTIYVQQLREWLGRALVTSLSDPTSYDSGGKRIANVGDPVAMNDAANRQFVVEALSNLATDGSGELVVERLADPVRPDNGAEMVGWRRKPVIDAISTVGSFLSSQAINLWEFAQYANRSSGVSPALWDWSDALQLAINYIVSIAEAKNSVNGLPRIEIPGGHYRITKTIYTKPWIGICSDGPVTLDYTGAGNIEGIVCDNVTTVTHQSHRSWAGNIAPFLNGAKGGIAILRDENHQTSDKACLIIGNRTAGNQPVRDTKIANVVISGWRFAKEFGPYDTYMHTATGCRFEGNTYCIRKPDVVGSNSGERISYYDCTFAGADAVLLHYGVGFDFDFIGCSFDFNVDIVRFHAGSRYTSVRLQSCYVESVGGYIVNGAGLNSSPNQNQVAVMVDQLIALPRGRRGTDLNVNSPSRPLFVGRFQLSVSGYRPRYERVPYDEYGAFVGSDVDLVSCEGLMYSGFRSFPVNWGFVNLDWDFAHNNADQDINVAPYWQIETGSSANITDRSFRNVTIAGQTRKVWRVSGTNASIAILSRKTWPCREGEVFWASAAVSLAEGASGTVNIGAAVEFLDSDGNRLAVLPPQNNSSATEAFAADVPGSANGYNRVMSLSAHRAVAPYGTVQARMRLAVSSFSGTVHVLKGRVWKE